MTCPQCQLQNRPAANFCRRCAARLVSNCPRCRVELLPDSAYCDNCLLPLTAEAAYHWQTHAPEKSWPSPTTNLHPAEAVARGLDNPMPSQSIKTIASSDSQAQVDRQTFDSHSLLQRFLPPELAAKVEAARASGEMQGERRVVTMLFCDVKGSTAAAEQLDPEEWTEIINGAFEYMIRPVYRYEGTVARLMGDAILAFFGAPIAHEDDPQRAVLAGLDIVREMNPYRQSIQERWGIDFGVRVGINTGMVVVGAVGSDLRMEYTAMGDAINLAARMEQTAQPGTVQIAEDTHNLVAPLFEFEALGGIEIKGKAEPVLAYRVLHPQAIPGRLRGLFGKSAPLVGREAEWRKLTTALTRLHQGNGQIVCIVGEVGLGKSRLIEELYAKFLDELPAHLSRLEPQSPQNSLQSSSQMARWYATYSLSYETTYPYSLFKHFMQQVCGATPTDPPLILKQKLAAWIENFVPGPEQNGVSTVMDTLFGLVTDNEHALEGEAFKNQLFAVITSLVSLWVAELPGVIVCDDIHWSDPASVDLLLHLLALCERLPILFICALRPDRQAPAWMVKERADRDYAHRYTEIQLEPLSPAESRLLLQKLLVNDHISDVVSEQILAKASGNPFFIEEVVRGLIQEGVLVANERGEGWQLALNHGLQSIEIPDSLQSLLTARVDRLAAGQRYVLQIAALIGRTFYLRILRQVIQILADHRALASSGLESSIGDLQRLDLITQIALLPEPEYMFRQTLVQESVYNTILHRQRRIYHQQVGETIEQFFSDQLESYAIVLAHHFDAAGDAIRSLKYHTKAGDAAYRLHAHTEAIQHYTGALRTATAVETTTEERIHLLTRLGRALELSARMPEAIKHYERMAEQADNLGDWKMQLAALMPLATVYSIPSSLFDLNKGEALSQQTLALAQEHGDRAAEAKILWNMLNMNRFAGRTQQAQESGERSLQIAKDLDLKEQIAYTQSDLCHVYNRSGQYSKTKQTLVETQALWRALDNRPMLADSLSTAAYVHAYTGDFEASDAFAKEAREISESIQNRWGIAYSQWPAGMVFWERGHPQEAIEAMVKGISFADEADFAVAQTYLRADLACLFCELGEMERAWAFSQEAQELVRTRAQLRPYILARSALLHIATGDVATAQEILDAVWAHDGPIHLAQPRVLTVADCLLPLAQNDYDSAIQQCQQRSNELQKYGMYSFVPESLLLLSTALIATQRTDEAATTLQEALSVAQRLGAIWIQWRILAAQASLPGSELLHKEARTRACALIESIADRIDEPALRQGFLARPDVLQAMAEPA